MNARIGYFHSVILLVLIFDGIQSIQINGNADPSEEDGTRLKFLSERS